MRKLIFCLIISSLFLLPAHAQQWQGKPLIEFNLKDQNGEIRNNKDFKDSWLVLYFYPKDNTSGCTLEAKNFTEDYAKYQVLNTNIVGVSFDDVDSHKAFAETYEMPFTLLADTDKQLAKALNVDRFLPWPHASRQTFLVDPQGVIRKHYSDVTPSKHSAELLADLEKLQSDSL